MPVGENNDPEFENVCLLCGCCPCTSLIDRCFQSLFPEAIEFVEEQPISANDLFKKKEDENSQTTTLFRIIGFLCMLGGIYLFFSPIIALVAWIPLVGYMLAQGISIVVFVFALITAGTLTSLTIACAWLYYRPLYGLLFLTLVGLGIGLLFFWPYDETAEVAPQ